MQFNNKITVVYTSLNDYAEEQESSEQEMSCCVVNYKIKREREKEGKRRRYALKIIASNRTFSPYKDLFDRSEALVFRYDGRTFEPDMISTINDFSGRIKYYELDLLEVMDGDSI